MIKISILTLSFNQAQYLEECIDSLLNQEYQDWEMIIIDPGSTDNSRDIATRYANLDSRIKTLFKSDSGPSEGLNNGFLLASGEVIGCLNADDMYLPHALFEVSAEFAKAIAVDCIYAHGLILKDGKRIFQSSDHFSPARYFTNRGLVMQQSTFFLKSSLIAKNVVFNPLNKSSWDGEFLVDLANAGGIFKKVRANWGIFRIYPESITGSNRLSILTKADHKRMIDNQRLLGYSPSCFEKLLMISRVYSVYRRCRSVYIGHRLS